MFPLSVVVKVSIDYLPCNILLTGIPVRASSACLWIAKPTLRFRFGFRIPSLKLTHGKFRGGISVTIVKDERAMWTTETYPRSAIGEGDHIEPSTIRKLSLDIFTICIWLHVLLLL